MRKFIPSTGGHPIKLNDLNLIQSNSFIGFNAVLEGLCGRYSNTGVYVNGCVKTVTGVGIGAVANFSAGTIYWKGEFYEVDAQSFPNSPTISIWQDEYWTVQQEILSGSPATYQNGTVNNVHLREKITWGIRSIASPGLNAFVISNVVYLEQILGMPQHTIVPYNGPLGNFSALGYGKRGTPVFGWVACWLPSSATALTFNHPLDGPIVVPKLGGRTLVQYDTTNVDFNTLGKIGGAKTHILTKGQIPTHVHSLKRFGIATNPGPPNANGVASIIPLAAGVDMNTEDGTADGLLGLEHNNLQPYHAINYIYKLY